MHGTDIVFRLLNKNEHARYRTIWLECLKNHPANFGPDLADESRRSTHKLSHAFGDEPGSDFVCGAFSGEALIGICGFIRETMPKTRHRGHITQMYVSPPAAGKGAGKGLLQAAIAQAFADPAIEQITLTVVSTNKSAIAIYEKAGFKKYGVLENCIKNETGYADDVLMVLTRAGHFEKQQTGNH